MREKLIWFFNRECQYCTDLEPEIEEFVKLQNIELIRVEAELEDPDTKDAQVPAIMYSHPKVKNHMFIGRFCLDALRYCLNNG